MSYELVMLIAATVGLLVTFVLGAADGDRLALPILAMSVGFMLVAMFVGQASP